jgi:hypothetical protein
LSDWLEDESLVFNSLTTISLGDNGAQQELNTGLSFSGLSSTVRL